MLRPHIHCSCRKCLRDGLLRHRGLRLHDRGTFGFDTRVVRLRRPEGRRRPVLAYHLNRTASGCRVAVLVPGGDLKRDGALPLKRSDGLGVRTAARALHRFGHALVPEHHGDDPGLLAHAGAHLGPGGIVPAGAPGAWICRSRTATLSEGASESSLSAEVFGSSADGVGPPGERPGSSGEGLEVSSPVTSTPRAGGA